MLLKAVGGNNKYMKSLLKKFQQFKKQTNLTTQIIIVVGIVAVINFLSYQFFTRVDLTENKIYSISQTSKEAMRNLDDIVNVKVYFSNELPPQYLNVRQEVKDILAEYQNYANNKLAVEFIDPKDNPQVQQDLQAMGVPPLQFNVLANDKYEVITGYLGIVVQYGDNKQAIPVVQDTENLEYQLTSAIKKVTMTEVPVIGFSTGHDELTLDSDISALNKKLSQIYTVKTVDLTNGMDIASDITTLVMAGPKSTFTDRQKYIIDQFIMRGGHVIFLVNGMNTDQNLQATPNDTGLDTLLSAYGAKVEKYFVLDKQNDRASFTQGFLSFTTNYPFFVRVTDSDLNQDNPAVAKLNNIILPWASPVTINQDVNNINALAWTTADAWLMKDNFNLNPQGDFAYAPDSQTYNLAVVRSGQINSAFDSYIAKDNEEGNHLVSAEDSKIVVIGDDKFITDGFVQRYPANLVLMQNLVDYTSLDSDLINIRAKTVNERPLEDISDARKKNIKYFNIFGVTLLVLGFGLTRYYLRKKNKFTDEL